MKYFLTILATIATFACKAQDNTAVHKTVGDFFELFSSRDIPKLAELTTDDVIIVEDGEIWNRDSIAKFLGKPAPADFKRENTMKFLDTNIRGDVAWTTYENTARIMANQRRFIVVWLETAILVNQNKRWKIRTLHSTTRENRRQ